MSTTVSKKEYLPHNHEVLQLTIHEASYRRLSKDQLVELPYYSSRDFIRFVIIGCEALSTLQPL